jgi:hypothetical protein
MTLPSDKPGSSIIDGETKRTVIVESDGVMVNMNTGRPGVVGEPSSEWVLTDINRAYQACPTYPRYLGK